MSPHTPEPAAPVAPAAAGPAREEAVAPFLPRVVLVGLAPLAFLSLAGLPYYRLPPAERPWSPLHPWLRPSGTVGQSAGLLALALLGFLWLYPIRKRFRRLRGVGSLAAWLDAHVAAGILVPLVAAVHAAWRFSGLIGLGYGAMLLVALSGVIGRYVYLRIPRRRDGLELTREEIAARRRELAGEIVAASGFPPERVLALLRPTPLPAARCGLVRTLASMVADDFARRRAIRELLREWRRSPAGGAPPAPEVLRAIPRLARQEMALSQQVRLLESTQRVFRFWHAAHRPVAITALLAVAVHVAVVVAVGATWLR